MSVFDEVFHQAGVVPDAVVWYGWFGDWVPLLVDDGIPKVNLWFEWFDFDAFLVCDVFVETLLVFARVVRCVEEFGGVLVCSHRSVARRAIYSFDWKQCFASFVLADE